MDHLMDFFACKNKVKKEKIQIFRKNKKPIQEGRAFWVEKIKI
jgi:hypothetical protein